VKQLLTRRNFVVVTSAAGAGLALGLHASPSRHSNNLKSPPPQDFAPDTWLRIDPKGTVTITVAKSEMGQGVRTALPMIVAEELDADWSRVRVEQAVADGKYGSMSTGGSTSVRTSWERLRKAGAAARQMLLTAAAERWNVPPDECRTENGTVIHVPTGRTLGYGDVSEAAAKLPVPENPKLKDPKDFRIVGRRIPRTDTPEKVDGSARFGLDVRVPNMLHATVARCPVFGGKVASYDDAKVRTLPGVKEVLQIESGIAVIADSTWHSLKARDALTVQWDEGPSASLTSARISTMLKESLAKPAAVAEKSGDTSGALARAAKNLESIYEVPFLAHATMEPMNCTAFVRKDSCEVWAPTQNPQAVRREAAKITGLAEERILVQTTYLGGGFGRRLETDFAAEAIRISQRLSVPVQVTWSREDDMQHDFYRPVSMHLLQGGLDDNGKLVALTHRVAAPSIGEQRSPGRIKDGLDKGALEGAGQMPYDIPNVLIDYVMSNTPVPVGYWRSVFPSQTVFALESFIDELAAAASSDPYEFRRGMMEKNPKMKNVLDLAAEKAGWGKPLPGGRFRGIAFSPPAFFMTPVAQVAEISLDPKGQIRVHRVVAAIDCGIAVNPTGVEAQMESGIVYGLTAALKGQVTIDRGRVVQGNFDDYPLLTMEEMPEIEVHIVKSGDPPTGTGEPGLPATAPAVANAFFAATGKRLRHLPLHIS
jgi:isoquinoline 1-oxidoreductase beta subunit